MGQITCVTTLMTMGAMSVNLPCAERRMGSQVSCHLGCILVGFLSASPLGFPPGQNMQLAGKNVAQVMVN